MNRSKILFCLLFISWLSASSARAELLPSCRASDFGTVGDGVADDRPALQAALIACKTVHVGPGVFMVTRAGGAFYDLFLDEGRSLIGDSQATTVLMQAAGTGGGVRLIHVLGAHAVISDLTLDGNRANQTVDEHRAGIFDMAPGLQITRVTSQFFSGDGFYLYTGGTDAIVENSMATGNGRDGIVLAAGAHGATLVSNSFIKNAAQQVDSEPIGGTANNVTVVNNLIDPQGASGDYALTISGSASTARSTGWYVANNTINGATFAVWIDNSTITGNHGFNPSPKSCYTVYRTSVNVTISNNACTMNQTSENGLAGITVLGTGVGQSATNVSIVDNDITVTGSASNFGIQAQGAISVDIERNRLHGPGISSAPFGIYVRATIVDQDFQSVIIKGNTIENWGGYALGIAGNLTARLDSLEFSNNVMSNSAGSMPRAVTFLSDAIVLQQVHIGNTCSGDMIACY